MQSTEALVDLFKKEMVEPVTKMLEDKAKFCEEVDMSVLQHAMCLMKEEFLTRINRSVISSPESKKKRSSSNQDELSRTPPSLSASLSETDSSPEKATSLISDGISSSQSDVSQPDANGKTNEMMPKRNKKRSLEDTVQKLCDKKSKVLEEISEKRTPSPVSSTVVTPPATPNVIFPTMSSTPINTILLARLMNQNAQFPIVNPSMYLNALSLIQQQSVLSNYISKGNAAAQAIQAQNSPTTHLSTEVQQEATVECQSPEICVDDTKHEVDSDESSLSPCPSNGEDGSEPSETSLNLSTGEGDSEKPFVCMHKNCNKRFANKFLLKKHQFIHTGLRPHQCPYCNKRFNRKDNLLRHKKTHQPIDQTGAPTVPAPIQSTPPSGNTPTSSQSTGASFPMPSIPMPSNCFMMDNLKIDNFKFQMEVLKQYGQWKTN